MFTVLVLMSCADPDGHLRARIEGTLYEPDGTATEFKGSDRSRDNDLGGTAWVDPTGPKTETGNRWEITFQPELDAWGSFTSGSTVTMGDQRLLESDAWDGTGWTVGDVETLTASQDFGPLMLHYIQDEISYGDLEYAMGYRLEVTETTDSQFTGELLARFENGALLDATMEASGLRLPSEPGSDDDDPYGTGSGGGACATFSDQTSYYGDMQLDSLCWAAGSYGACGNTDGKEASCANLQGMEDCCYEGSGSCPYC